MTNFNFMTSALSPQFLRQCQGHRHHLDILGLLPPRAAPQISFLAPSGEGASVEAAPYFFRWSANDFVVLVLVGVSSEHEFRLVEYLFDQQGYNPLIRPVQNLTEKVEVGFNLALIQLINVVSITVVFAIVISAFVMSLGIL